MFKDIKKVKVQNGIFTEAKQASGFSLLKLFKRMLEYLHVPMADSCCPNEIDPTTLPVRMNKIENEGQYFDNDTMQWLPLPTGGSNLDITYNSQAPSNFVFPGGLNIVVNYVNYVKIEDLITIYFTLDVLTDFGDWTIEYTVPFEMANLLYVSGSAVAYNNGADPEARNIPVYITGGADTTQIYLIFTELTIGGANRIITGSLSYKTV